ncbi:MAG: hypothetical protein QM783_12175 [Phycisphaerales bacterium]
MRSIVVAFGACVLSAAAYGQVGLVAQARSVSGGISVPPASGFGLYSASSPGSSNNAAQTSDLSVTGATFDLSAGASGAGSSALTNLSFTFEVFQSVQFTLSGTIQFNQGPMAGGGGGSVHLTGPGVDLLGPTFGIFTTLPYNFSGTLNPGVYTLTANANGTGITEMGHARSGSGHTIGTLTLTPTPGAAATLLLGATAGLSRRRR